jgi:hypothetical protein
VSRWFRFYAEALDDPKVQKLDGDTFKAWVNLLCLAAKNQGYLPPIEDIAFGLRLSADGARTLVERLLSATLLDKESGGVDGYRYAPHGWQERQYKSDTSTERVKRFRKRSKTVTETPPETETETEDSEANASGGTPPADPLKQVFDLGVELLSSTGIPEKQARSLIGKWCKAKSTGAVIQGLVDCRAKAIVNPVEWLEKRFKPAKYVSESGYEYRGEIDDIIREAARRGDKQTEWVARGDLRRAASG